MTHFLHIHIHTLNTRKMPSLQLIVIEKAGTLKFTTVKDYSEPDLYKKCGFKTPVGFAKIFEWSCSETLTVSLYGKLTGKPDMLNLFKFNNEDIGQIYGNAILVGNNMQSLNIDVWNKISADILSPKPIDGSDLIPNDDDNDSETEKNKDGDDTKRDSDSDSEASKDDDNDDIDEDSVANDDIPDDNSDSEIDCESDGDNSDYGKNNCDNDAEVDAEIEADVDVNIDVDYCDLPELSEEPYDYTDESDVEK